MTRIRKNHSPSFKLRIGLEALKGEKTLAEISQEYSVHPSQVQKWKSQIEKDGSSLFEDKRKCKKSSVTEPSVSELHEKIGQLTMERDFLSKVLGR